ncbi:aminopeptidase [Patescibacteria group bacterium]|nr:MAG: aminopeptidase [Patescibacteria group bacterium]
MPYHPPQKILERYADVLVNFALGEGRGIRRGDVVLVRVSEAAKRLYAEVLKAVWKRGGHVIGQYAPDNEAWFRFDREFYTRATDKQLQFFPDKLLRGQVEQIDHVISIIADTDLKSLQGVPPQRMMVRGEAWKPYRDWMDEKENKGKFTWTVALCGTPAMAKEAGLSEREYWNQIIRACFLDSANPITRWRAVYEKIERYKRKLNKLEIGRLHVEGSDADLWITLGEKRVWKDGNGNNIPSFEIFTSPDWRGTEGWIRFNQPLYRYGNLIEGIELEFQKGKVVRCRARKNESVLKAMIVTSNADKVGEYSLTDRRFSRITKFMAETLFDENMGGPNGNTHIALGNAYHDCYRGDSSKVSKKKWKSLGFNNSSVHTDIISTAPRTVTAYLPSGKTKVIYKNGQFVL